MREIEEREKQRNERDRGAKKQRSERDRDRVVKQTEEREME